MPWEAARARVHSLRLGCAGHPSSIDVAMNIHLSLTPLISLIAGILILVMPKLLNFIVAIYLILVGLIGLFGTGTIKSWL